MRFTIHIANLSSSGSDYDAINKLMFAGDLVEVREHPVFGYGVFACKQIACGSFILKFGGEVLTSLPDPYIDDHYTQIGAQLFLGPSGHADDYINHSCGPNTALVPDRLELVALRDIALGEEITWDYSVYIPESDTWSIPCACGSDNCRGEISNWKRLPKEQQLFYRTRGLAPQYVDT